MFRDLSWLALTPLALLKSLLLKNLLRTLQPLPQPPAPGNLTIFFISGINTDKLLQFLSGKFIVEYLLVDLIYSMVCRIDGFS